MKYIEKLRNSGLRPTKQRLQICEVLFNSEKTFHFTINELDQKIKKQRSNKITVTIENSTNLLNHCLNHILSSLYLILDGVG